MPNIVAYAVISIWPIIILFLIKRYGLQSGVLMSLLGAYMFLPAGFEVNFPGIPAFDKFSVTIFVFMAYIFFTNKKIDFSSFNWTIKLIIFGYLVSPFFTAMTNKFAYLHLPGITFYDGISQTATNFIYFFPFLIGFKFFRDFNSQILIFKYFILAAFIYAFLALYEIRMSPQLHNTFYGYFPHEWLQQYRSGGYRAVVFMGHGLLVAMFLSLGLAFTTAINKSKIKTFPLNIKMIMIVLFITLLFSKSYAALVFALFSYLAITFFPTKLIHKGALFIALVFILYPFLSTSNIFPHQKIVNLASSFSSERAGSLNFRFENEARLLEHANKKPFFGWGGWGRNRVYDPETGQDISVSDGKWIITIGTLGWIGFLTQFLLIVLPVYFAYRIQPKVKDLLYSERILFASHTLIVAIILLDQMPNSSLNPLYWLVIGALLGRIYDINKQDKINSNRIPVSNLT